MVVAALPSHCHPHPHSLVILIATGGQVLAQVVAPEDILMLVDQEVVVVV
jgi:hypothetical protein